MAISSIPPGTVEVFYCYAHEDEPLLGELIKHLGILKRLGVIRGWHDRQITAGAEPKGQIDRHLDAAGVILLLVSVDFVNSDYIWDVELKRALERHDKREARVIPVILRHVDNWQAAPFGKLQAIPTDGRPVIDWTTRDQAFADVAGHIRRAVGELRNPLGGPSPPRGPKIPDETTSGVKKGEDIFVNRDEERNLFREMIHRETPVHILLIEGESGTGKSTLLDRFEVMSEREGFKRARVNFTDSSYTVCTVLRDLCKYYGQECFSELDKVCRELLASHGQVEPHFKLLWKRTDVVLGELPEKKRRLYQGLITNAFLADLDTIHKATGRLPFVALFDAFNPTSPAVNVKKWMEEVLIDEVRQYPWLVCVVAGQHTPRIAEKSHNWCLKQTLQLLTNSQAEEYIFHRIMFTQDDSLVKHIVKSSKGNHTLLEPSTYYIFDILVEHIVTSSKGIFALLKTNTDILLHSLKAIGK